MDFYTTNALACAKTTTHNYSTSFSLGVWMLKKEYRTAIYAIYGFVRFADEIVDTFHDHDKNKLIQEFKSDTWKALDTGISTNPILEAFQWAVNTYHIEREHIEAFFYSMELDLFKTRYTREEYQKYIYGSAEVVGLMCLRVFYHAEPEEYKRLVYPARKLGEAFQKVNFLRDMLSDYHDRDRVYFPNIDFNEFTPQKKTEIEQEIADDFRAAFWGIKELRKDVRLGVYLAYKYYLKLLVKIQKAKPEELLEQRFRISNTKKMLLLIQAYMRNAFNLIK